MCGCSLFIAHFWTSTEVVYLQYCLVVTWLVPHEIVAVLACFVYTIQPCASLQWHFIQSQICRVHACSAVTHHLHLLHASEVTQRWNGYQNKSQHTKLTTKKKILLPLLLGHKPAIFQLWVQCCTTELSKLFRSPCSHDIVSMLCDSVECTVALKIV